MALHIFMRVQNLRLAKWWNLQIVRSAAKFQSPAKIVKVFCRVPGKYFIHSATQLLKRRVYNTNVLKLDMQ